MPTIILKRNEVKKKKSKCFIPTYYDCNIKCIKDNIKIITNNDGKSVMYITPLLKIIISDLKHMIPKHQESLSRNIKEKLCSNSRLLIKKGCENSKIIKIKDIEFVLVNNEIEIIDEFNIRINNQRSKLNSLI